MESMIKLNCQELIRTLNFNRKFSKRLTINLISSCWSIRWFYFYSPRFQFLRILWLELIWWRWISVDIHSIMQWLIQFVLYFDRRAVTKRKWNRKKRPAWIWWKSSKDSAACRWCSARKCWPLWRNCCSTPFPSAIRWKTRAGPGST